MQEQVADFLAGIRAQAVELQTDAEQDMEVAGLKELLPVGLTTLLSPFPWPSLSRSYLGSPDKAVQGFLSKREHGETAPELGWHQPEEAVPAGAREGKGVQGPQGVREGLRRG